MNNDMKNPLVKEIAQRVQARINCEQSGNREWFVHHTDAILGLVESFMPSGSGVDNGTKINLDESSGNKLVFDIGYHHMNDGGYYDGWTEHQVIVTPSLASSFDLRITGRDRNQIKEYLTGLYQGALSTMVEWNSKQDKMTVAA